MSQVNLGPPSDPPAGAQLTVKALVGFERITLAPGESKTVILDLPARRFQYWSVADNRGERAPARRTVYVGASPRDIRLPQQVSIGLAGQ